MALPTEKLLQLLDAATELDKRVDSMASHPLNILKPEDICGILMAFGEKLHQMDEDLALYDDTRYNPMLVVNKAIADGSQFSDDTSLSLHAICQLKLIEFTFAQLEKEQELHAMAYNVLQLMQFAFVRGLLRDPSAIFEQNHPARNFFELATKICKQCDEASCPRALDILKSLRSAILEAVAAARPPIESFVAANKQVVGFMHDYNERLSHQEERLVAKEKNQRKLYDVRHTVHDVITRAAEGKKIPTFALHFLHEVWSKYLYITYLRLGVESPQWREGISDMYQLIWSLVTRDGEELNKRMAGRLSESLRRIKKHTETVHHALEIDRFFNALAEFHAKIIDNKEMDPTLFQGAEAIGSEAETEQARDASAQNLTLEVKAATKGDWFRIDQRGRESRAKLIEKDEESGFMLFADYSGVLGAKLNFSEYTHQFRQGAIRPLDMNPAFEPAMRQALGRLERYIAKINEQITNKEKEIEERRQRDAELARQRQLARQQMEKQRREEQEEAERKERVRQELELKRQLEEETQRQEEAARLEAERKAEEIRRVREEALNKALAEVSQLEPGGMVELTDDNRDIKICSLSLKLKRTGKLVFSDRTGRRVAEHLPEEFAERLQQGSARIIDYGTTGDKRLDDLRWTRLTEGTG